MPYDTYVALPGSQKRRHPTAERIADVTPSERTQILVRLHPSHGQSEFLNRGFAIINAQWPYWERGQAPDAEARRSLFAADPASRAALTQFAEHFHLQIAWMNARAAVLSGTLANLVTAFGLNPQMLGIYRHPNGTVYRGREGAIGLPTELQGHIRSVHGFDTRPVARPMFKRLPLGPDLQSVGEAQSPTPILSANAVATAYQFPPRSNARAQTLAVGELGGGFTQVDITTYFSRVGQAAPPVDAIDVAGGTNAPVGNPDSADGEVEPDIEIGGVCAPNGIAALFAPNTDAGMIALLEAPLDMSPVPDVFSLSWAGAEGEYTQQSVDAIESILEEYAVAEISFLCAAGDAQGVNYPSSSPNGTGVCGTRLTLRNGQVASESVWNDPDDGCTAGGYSSLFPRPGYQNGIVDNEMRGAADITGNASPATGYPVVVDAQLIVEGGTSLITPEYASLICAINSYLPRNLGFLNPTLYAIAQQPGQTAIRGITQGGNGQYSANPDGGWSPVTGLGALNGAALLAALQAGPAPVGTTPVVSVSGPTAPAENEPVTYTATLVPADPNATYAWQSALAGTFSPASGSSPQTSWTPSEVGAGSVVCTAVTNGQTVQGSINVTVQANPNNPTPPAPTGGPGPCMTFIDWLNALSEWVLANPSQALYEYSSIISAAEQWTEFFTSVDGLLATLPDGVRPSMPDARSHAPDAPARPLMTGPLWLASAP